MSTKRKSLTAEQLLLVMWADWLARPDTRLVLVDRGDEVEIEAQHVVEVTSHAT